jgi:hypothetical protein
VQLIRKRTFETNSSSCHSFTRDWTDSVNLTTIIPPDDTTIYVGLSGCYGWGRDEFTDPETKLDYICMQFFGDEEMLSEIKQIVETHTGYKVEISDQVDGYIDHQSVGILNSLRSDSEAIRNFIFNPAWKLIIDNDN